MHLSHCFALIAWLRFKEDGLPFRRSLKSHWAEQLVAKASVPHKAGASIRPASHHRRRLQDHRSLIHGTSVLKKRLQPVVNAASQVLLTQPLRHPVRPPLGRSRRLPSERFLPSLPRSAPLMPTLPPSVAPAIFSRLIPPFLRKFLIN